VVVVNTVLRITPADSKLSVHNKEEVKTLWRVFFHLCLDAFTTRKEVRQALYLPRYYYLVIEDGSCLRTKLGKYLRFYSLFSILLFTRND
jgi:hypothetical protein